MSAPSLFDRLVSQSMRPPSERRRPQPFAAARERRSSRATDVLSREHDSLCRNATDHLEIAAGLEAAGISDLHALASYQAASVFELAGQLYEQVPRRPLAVARADPWARPARELMARGLVYALPGLLLIVTMRHLIASDVMLLLLVSVLSSGATQALSWLYHGLLGRRRPRAAGALMQRALVGSVVGGVVLAWLAVWLGAASWPGAVVTAMVATYLVSATVVLLLDQHRLLLRLLIPAVALCLLTIFLPAQLLPRDVVVIAQLVSLVSVVGAFAAAWRLAGVLAGSEKPARVESLTRRDAGQLARRVAVQLTRRDLVGCLLPIAHGCLSMSLISLIPLSSLRTGSGIPEALGPVMLPAMLSLGAAEVHLYGFRQRAAGLLAGHDQRLFARALRVHLLSRVASYALLLGALTAAVAVVGHRSLAADANAPAHLLTYLLLCVALLVASLLVSTGHVRAVAIIEAAALLLDVALAHLPILAPLTSAAVHLAAAGALAATMLVFGTKLLGRVVSYR